MWKKNKRLTYPNRGSSSWQKKKKKKEVVVIYLTVLAGAKALVV